MDINKHESKFKNAITTKFVYEVRKKSFETTYSDNVEKRVFLET